MSNGVDKDALTELAIYIDNDGDLYRQRFIPIVKNLMRKRAAGKYDSTKAAKLFMYLVEAGAKKYDVEFGAGGSEWNKVFSKPTREALSRDLVKTFETEADLGNYDQYIQKKYQKR